MSVNGQTIATAIERYIPAHNPWFEAEYCRLVEEIRSISWSAMFTTATETGLRPSQICAAMRLPKDGA